MAAMIPSDVGVRLRLPGDTGLAPTAPVADIPSDLPDLQPGQTFTARIQDILPENTYRALVAGRALTLSLPEGAKAGDVLELVVVDRTAQTVVARAANPNAGASAADTLFQHTTLSPAGQLIGKLLAENPAQQQATPLNRSQPVINAPPTNAAQLAGALEKAVTQSGMFYEAHQAQWIAGKRPLASLLQEPQAQWSLPEAAVRAAREAAQPASGQTAGNANAAPATDLAQARGDIARADLASVPDSSDRAPATRSEVQAMPDELRPLVQQQLEAAANQRLVWHGEVWPGQTMEWEIEEEARRETAGGAEEIPPWQTTLRLTTPRLGQVEARLRIVGNQLQLNLSTPVGASASDLRDELPELKNALAAVGIDLQAAQVRHEPV